MRFIETKRFSPVVYLDDLPREGDLFHFRAPDIPVLKKDRVAFLKENNIFIDRDWWNKQITRCLYGYDIPNAIEPGGDAIEDGVDCFWEGDDCFIPQYDLLIRNKTIHISGRYYFYLNFWPIFAVMPGTEIKGLTNPLFVDMDFLFSQRVEMMFDKKKDGQELKRRQAGFEQPNSEKVLTDKGWVEMGKISVGDMVATRTNSFTKVIEVFPQGSKDVYELELIDGRKVRCGKNHLWKVYNKRLKVKKEVVLSTQQMIDWGLTKKASGNNISYQFAIPDIEPIEYPKKDLPIDPYLLGLLLGDGTINKGLKLASIDMEIIENVSNILGLDYTLKKDGVGTKNCNYRIVYHNVFDKEQHLKYNICGNLKLNPIIEELKLLNLRKKCNDKFIPDIYKHSSIEQRLEIVKGLMDSDGYISKDGKIEFKNTCKQLSNDLVYILRSLGIKCRINEFESKQGFKNYFRVYIQTSKFNVFKLKRKADLFRYDKKTVERYSIVNIKKLDYKEECTCILLNDNDHIYLTTDFIPTHNSEKIAGMILAYNYTFLPASFNVVVGGSSDDAQHTMDNTIRGLNFLINTQFYLERKRGGDNAEHIVSKKTQSEIIAITAKDNNQAISRFSPTIVVYEEVGKGKKEWSINTAAFVKPSLYAQNGIKTGYNIFIGTGGEMSEGVYDLETRTYNPREFNLLEFKNIWTELSTEYGDTVGHFTPGWWMKVIDKEGNSLKSEGLKLIEKEFKLCSAKDKYRYRTQMPTYIEQVFLSSNAGFFGEEAIKLLNNRYSLIRNTRSLQIERQGILEWKNPRKPWEGVSFKPKDGGWLNIIEEPNTDADGNVYINLYEVGIDSYDQDEAHTSDSKGACYVRKKYLPGQPLFNCYVAEIIERPSIEDGGAMTFYLHAVMVTMWYKCQCNIEYSNLRIFDFFKVNGFEPLLKKKPRLAFAGKVANTKVSNEYGTDKSLKPHVLAILRDTLTPEFVDRMYFTRQIRAFSKFIYDPSGRKYNCDITIASAEAEVGAKESEMIPVKSAKDIEEKITYRKFQTVNGRIQSVYSN